MQLSQGEILHFYGRKDVQRNLVSFARDREVAVNFGEKGFGKRPDVLQYENDIYELAKQGATSFHLSEERWANPLHLKTGMTKPQLDELRTGFDCVLDIDTPFLEYSKVVAALILEVLKFYNIHTFGLKFSGNRGFHFMIPFESFPDTINTIPTKNLFPEAPRFIAEYLKNLIREKLSEQILTLNTAKEIAHALKKKNEDLFEKGTFNPFSFMDIDTVLISSRHLFRAPYSINEKSGLVSIPLQPIDLKRFTIARSKINNVTTDIPFFKTPPLAEASRFIMQAYDHSKKMSAPVPLKEEKRNYHDIEDKISEHHFPPCINLILQGLPSDGRKRAIFILLNFLKKMNYPLSEIDGLLHTWNEKNYEKVKEGYLQAQISWHQRQKEKILPPNCDNAMYYQGIGVCKPDAFCKFIKNPAQYALKKYQLNAQRENSRKKRPRFQKGEVLIK